MHSEDIDGHALDDTFWTRNVNGRELKVCLCDLIDVLKVTPTIDVPTAVLHPASKKPQLAQKTTHGKAEYPVIAIADEKGIVCLIDHHFRVEQAMISGVPTLPTKVIEISQVNDTFKSIFL